MKCVKCGSTEIYSDGLRGLKSCLKCHATQEEAMIVSELSFNDHNVMGTFGSKSGNYSGLVGLNCLTDSQEKRLNKANRLIQQLAMDFNLPQYQVDMAQGYFKLAYKRSFVRGRRTLHVAAAVLYTVCRKEKVPLLLIDFSASLHINLYVLGHCFLQLVKYLHIEQDVPLVDPSLFIHKYCSKLDFEDKTHEVIKTASRLLQRMKLDWICYGRRPSSLCGAAILIAARYHGFNRTTGQIVQTVHCCDETIRKRLEEFKETSVAQLTRAQFENNEEAQLEPESFPPSFKRAQKTRAPLQLKNGEEERILMEADKIENLENQLSNITNKLDHQDPNTEIDLITENVNIIKKELSNKETCSEKKEVDSNSEEGLSDVDDAEISQFFLSPEEAAMKSIIWHNMHKVWVKEQAEKKDLKNEKNPKKRKKKENERVFANNPLEAIQNHSKFKDKISYESLVPLFEDSDPFKKLKTV